MVVEGGLNDYNQPSADIRAGFDRLMSQLHGHRVVVVGPPSAPSRAHAVPRVDELLADLSEEYGVAYVRTSGWSLPYLDDRLHLTPAGHRTFGDNVAQEIATLVLTMSWIERPFDEAEGEAGADPDGLLGVGEQVVGDRAADQGVAPLVEVDQVGEYLVAQPAGPAGGPVHAQLAAHDANSSAVTGTTRSRDASRHRPSPCAETSAANVPSSDRTRRTVPSGWAQAPRRSTRVASCGDPHRTTAIRRVRRRGHRRVPEVR